MCTQTFIVCMTEELTVNTIHKWQMSCSMLVNSSSEMRPSPETSMSLKMRSSLRIYFFFVAWQAGGTSTGSNTNQHKNFTSDFFSATHYPNNLATSGAGLSEMYIRIDQNSHKLVLRTNASFSDMTTSWSSPAASSVSFRSCIYMKCAD